jgi:polyribonucleotide nucleotidyltransferase
LDGLLHISEVAEHRIKDVRDELKEGDQVLVKVLAVEGNRIKLSRKAILKEQRAKMGGAPPPPEGDEGVDAAPPSVSQSAPQGSPTAVIEGGADFDADDEPNFNRVDGVVASVEAGAARPEGTRDARPSGGGDRDRNRRRRGRGGPGRGPGGGSGGHGGGHSGGGGGRGRR